MLGVFACAYGAHDAFHAWVLVTSASGAAVVWTDAALLAVAWFALFEFGRRTGGPSDEAGASKLPLGRSSWIYAPAFTAILTLVWLAADRAGGLSTASGYFLGFPGALLAGVMLHRAWPSGGAWVLILGGALAGFGIFGGLISAHASSISHWLPTQNWFLAVTGVPVQAVLASLAFVAIFALVALQRRAAEDNPALPGAGRPPNRDLLLEQHLISLRAGFRAATEAHDRAQRIARMGSWEYAPGHDTFELSDGICRILEIDPARFGGSYREFLEAVHPADRGSVVEAFEKSIAGQTPLEITHRVRMPDGRTKWVQERGETDFAADGTPLVARGTLQDVTELKLVEQRLVESENRLMRATEMTGLGYFVWDLVENRCVYCSREYARIHGMTVEEYMSDCASSERDLLLVHPDDREMYQRFLDSTLKRRERLNLEYRIVTPEGKVRYVHEVEGKLEFEGDRAVRSEGTIQDITEIREAEHRLQQAQKMEAVGQLSGGLAHDINNILAVIVGNAELLAEASERDVAELESILRSAERGAELTQQLLAFSRQQTLKPQAVDLEKLVEDTTKLFGRTLGADVELRLVQAPDLWLAWVDPGQLQSGLLNLAINARAAMPDGGRLTISLRNAPSDSVRGTVNPGLAPGDYTVIEVADTGVGMSARVLAHAFEPFFSTKDVGEGSGLGLSMVYGFVRQSGGYVSLDSTEGQGTTVTIQLPRAVTRSATAISAMGNEDLRGGGQVVLVLEDDPDVRKLAMRMLHSLGYQAIEAADARSADAMLRDGAHVDIVLSDVVLPGGTSGPKFLAEVLATRPELKAVLMSGYASGDSGYAELAHDNVVLLRKPFHKSELAEAMREAVSSRERHPD